MPIICTLWNRYLRVIGWDSVKIWLVVATESDITWEVVVRIPDPWNSSLEFGLDSKGQGWRLLWSSTRKTPWLFLHKQSKFGVNFFKI